MLKIGEFSIICHVPVKTIRYYDQVGLLHPQLVEPYTGYRYYQAAQMDQLNRILALKDLGFTLRQIRVLLEGKLTPEQMRAYYTARQQELARRVEEEQHRLQRVQNRLYQIELEESMSPYECVVKSVPALKIASVRGIVPAYNRQDKLWDELEPALHRGGIKPCGPCFVLDHNDEYKENNVDLEACEPIDQDFPVSGNVQIRTLPAVQTMASTVHRGPFTALPQAYPALVKWIDANGWRISGPGREIYIYVGEGPVVQDDPSYVTEIQFPVERA